MKTSINIIPIGSFVGPRIDKLDLRRCSVALTDGKTDQGNHVVTALGMDCIKL